MRAAAWRRKDSNTCFFFFFFFFRFTFSYLPQLSDLHLNTQGGSACARARESRRPNTLRVRRAGAPRSCSSPGKWGRGRPRLRGCAARMPKARRRAALQGPQPILSVRGAVAAPWRAELLQPVRPWWRSRQPWRTGSCAAAALLDAARRAVMHTSLYKNHCGAADTCHSAPVNISTGTRRHLKYQSRHVFLSPPAVTISPLGSQCSPLPVPVSRMAASCAGAQNSVIAHSRAPRTPSGKSRARLLER